MSSQQSLRHVAISPPSDWVVRSLMFIGFALFFTIFFGPVLFSGRYMTSGDGLLQALPTFLGRNPIWEPNMMLGYPLFADPNQAFWYPLLRIARYFPHAFNAYVVAPYVIASFGIASFAHRVSSSVSGAVVAGLTFGLSGFMISHQGHINLIHPAAWTPYLLWTVEELRRRPRAVVAAGGALAFALCAVSGPQQLLAYMSVIALAYAVVFAPNDTAMRRKFWAYVVVTFGFGLGLAAIAVVPSAELTLASVRATQTYESFSVFSVGLVELPIRAFFPYFFGATEAPSFPWSHENVGAFTEVSNYAGILPLMLGVLALIRKPFRRQSWFWASVALWGLWMSLGDALGAGHLAYRLPFYGLFRIPGRHALEFTFAIALLAALGVASIAQARVRTREIAYAILPIAIIFATVLASIATYGDTFRSTVANANHVFGIGPVPSVVWQNAALAIPCGVLVLGAIALVLWVRLANRSFANVLGIIAVTLDLSSFAGFSYWRYDTVAMEIATPPPFVTQIRSSLGDRRLLASLGARAAQSVPPNLSTLWDVSTVGGYVSLEDRRVAKFLRMEPTGEIPAGSLGQYGDSSLDLVGTRYLLVPPEPIREISSAVRFSTENLAGFIGADALTPQKTVAYGLSLPKFATAIGLVSALGNSTLIANGTHVAEIIVTDDSHRTFSLPIVAGRDTSESAYDRPDVRTLIRHARAAIFGGDMAAHIYSARFTAPTNRPIVSLKIHWLLSDSVDGALSIVHFSLLDERKGLAYPIAISDQFNAQPGHWLQRGNVGPDLLLENMRPLPAAWTVATAQTLDDAAALRVIRFAAGDRIFDPRSRAFVSDRSQSFETNRHFDGKVRLFASTPTATSYDTECSTRCMLVVNGLWYAGWHAMIDATPVPVERVDYLLRGVAVPAGRHVVKMWFAPVSLAIGITLSSFSCIALLSLLIVIGRRPKTTATTSP